MMTLFTPKSLPLGVLLVLLGCTSDRPPRMSEEALLPPRTLPGEAQTQGASAPTDSPAGVVLGTVRAPDWQTQLPEALRALEVQGLMLFKADLTEALIAWYRLEGRWPHSVSELQARHLLPYVPVAAGGHAVALLDRDANPSTPAFARFTFTADAVEYQVFLRDTPLDHGRVTRADILARLSGMRSAMPPEGPAHASIGQQLIAGEEPEAALCLHWASLWLRRVEAYVALEGHFPAALHELDRALGQTPAGSPALSLCDAIGQVQEPPGYFSVSLDPAHGRWEAGMQLRDRPFRGWRYTYRIDPQSGRFPSEPGITDAGNRLEASTCVLAWPCSDFDPSAPEDAHSQESAGPL